jgi:hypothetical protein
MKIIVKESQYRKILLEERKFGIQKKISELKNFFNDLVDGIKKQIGLDLSFLSTWGVTIAGFVKPINDFIQNKYEGISNQDLLLISVGLVLTYYQSNKDRLKKVLKEIKERDLEKEFNSMLNVSERLKKVFVSFIESLAVPTLKFANILAYTFIIPLIGDLLNLVMGEPESIDPSEIVKRIIGYFTLNVGGEVVKRLLLAIVKRFKS